MDEMEEEFGLNKELHEDSENLEGGLGIEEDEDELEGGVVPPLDETHDSY